VVGTAASSASRAGTILAFDFGTRRIGVAVGERSIGLAHPLATIAGEQNEHRFAAIESLIEDGIPRCWSSACRCMPMAPSTP
jgi:putative Holliday junction resolvase